jgi:hypothetical protein
MSLAWHTAAMHPRRMRRMPKLEDLIGRVKRAPHQSWEQMRNIARMITVLHGGTVAKHKE